MTNTANTETYEYLLEQYGPLLTIKHVAELMHTTPRVICRAINRNRQSFAVGLVSAKRKLGRRVYFEARRVADVIDEDREKSVLFIKSERKGNDNGNEKISIEI